jgi:RNA polymerase sigma factor (TIGR02999 family)
MRCAQLSESHRFPLNWLTNRHRGEQEVNFAMAESAQTTITTLLLEAQAGNREALRDLFALVYDELRVLARRQRRQWRGDFTVNTTALVHEAYLKLVGQEAPGAASRTHFLCVAAKAMRHILCNYARDRLRQKRGGDLARISLTDIDTMPATPAFSPEQADVLVALDAALHQLDAMHQDLSAIVECRFFGDMSIEDTAAALGLSPATVKRRWMLARSWLYRELKVHAAAPRT